MHQTWLFLSLIISAIDTVHTHLKTRLTMVLIMISLLQIGFMVRFTASINLLSENYLCLKYIIQVKNEIAFVT